MKRLAYTVYLWVLGRLQALCTHPPEHVTADLLEGSGGVYSVQHCKVCGAARPVSYGTWGTWRGGRADWEIGQ